jgi:hypothetical protein
MNIRAADVDVDVVVLSVARPTRPPAATTSSAPVREVALPKKRAWGPPRVRTVEPSAPSLLLAGSAPSSGLQMEHCCNPDEQPPCSSGTAGNDCAS